MGRMADFGGRMEIPARLVLLPALLLLLGCCEVGYSSEWAGPFRFDPGVGSVYSASYWQAGERIFYSYAFPDNSMGVLKKIGGSWEGPFPLGAEVDRVSDGGGMLPRVSPNGKTLIFLRGNFFFIAFREDTTCDSCWNTPRWMEVPGYALLNINLFDYSLVDTNKIYFLSGGLAYGFTAPVVSLTFNSEGVGQSVEVYPRIVPYWIGPIFSLACGDSAIFYTIGVSTGDSLHDRLAKAYGAPGAWSSTLDTIPLHWILVSGATSNSTGNILWSGMSGQF